MKKLIKSMRAIFTAVVLLAAANAAVADYADIPVPKNHEKFMKNESYKKSFELLTAMTDRAKANENLTPDEYRAIAEETHQTIAGWVGYLMREYGTSEIRAYDLAYADRGRSLRFDWLRKNAEGAQGFYGHMEYAPVVMMIEKSNEKDEYAVQIDNGLNEEPFLLSFTGVGKLSGKIMTVPYNGDENAVVITFEGENAIVATSRTFKDTHTLAQEMTIDGTYIKDM